MANLFGTSPNQAPLNSMLGNLAFQDKAFVSVDKIGIGTTAVDTGTSGQVVQAYGGAYVSGSLGIGTTNPTYKTHIVDTAATGAGLLVQGGGQGSPIARFERTVGATGLLVDVNASGSDPQIVFNRVGVTTFAVGLNIGGGAAGGDIFEIASSGALGTNTRFVIDSSNGNVGIGTTNPVGQLQVASGPVIIGAATSTGTSSQRLQVTGGAYVSGNLGVGTTNPLTTLHVVGTGATTLLVTGNARITGILTIGTASITLDGSTNTGTIGTSRIVSLASGIRTLFYESTAPTGWTKVTTHHDKCLRVVNTTGGGSGGTSAFTTVMASRTPAGSVSGSNSGGSIANTTVTGSVSGSNSGGSVSNTTLGINEIPSHSHTINEISIDAPGGCGATQFTGGYSCTRSATAANGGSGAHGHGFTNPSWSGSVSMNAHNHTLTNPTWNGSFSGTAMDFAVQYIDLLLCSID